MAMTRRVPSVTCMQDYDSFRVYIAGSLHVYFRTADFRGLSSFKPRHDCWSIEIVLRDGVIELEYDERPLWLAVLAIMDEMR